MVTSEKLTDVTADAATDVTADAATDATADKATDVTADAATDVTADAATDVTADAATDAATDAAADVTADAATDATADKATDAAADKATDKATDVTADKATDKATDKAAVVINVKAVIALLADKFPNCFSTEGEAKALKIGIFKDLNARFGDDEVVSRTQLRQALRRYTSSWRYLKCVAKGGSRFNLDGEPDAVLETEHIEHAAKALEQSKARYEENRKARKDKKFYKKPQNDTGETAKKQVKFNGSKRRSDKAAKKHAVSGSNKGGKRSDKSVNKNIDADSRPAELRPLTGDDKKAGTAVLVKFGNSPVPGVIKEVSKNDVHVQLNSGMVIKTKPDSLFVV